MSTRFKKLYKWIVVPCLIIIMTTICFLTACQGTPEQNAVAQKGDALEEGIKQTAPPTDQTAGENDTEERWEYQKAYDSGNRLNVNAVIINKNKADIPVISVREKPFEGGQQLRNIVDVFCPGAKVLENVGFTKQHLDQEILEVKELMFRVENDMPLYQGTTEIIPDNQKEDFLQQLNDAMEYYEKELETAPDISEVDEASFELRDVGGSFQSNMQAVIDDRVVYLNFTNWDDVPGSDFYLRDAKYESDEQIASFKNPSSLSDDDTFLKEKETIDAILQDIGIDYMALDSISKNKHGYCYYYTREANDFQETYAKAYLGEVQTEGEVAIDLFESEHFEIETRDGQVVKANWNNPTEVIKEDNSNVRVLPWEQIQETFKTQMDYMLSPDTESMGDTDVMMFAEGTEIHINKIELGLTKVLMKDSGGDYKLIPAWSFMGYDTNYVQEGPEHGSDLCYLTVSAIDGTVIDRGLMY